MVSISFEFAPPYNPQGAKKLDECAAFLTSFRHDFISVNFGGGLVPKERAIQTLVHLSEKFNSAMVAHLICTGASKTDLSSLALRLKHLKMDKIFVMHGNPNLLLSSRKDKHYGSIKEMLDALTKIHSFHYYIAGYPDGHPLGKGYDYSVDDIKARIDAGAKEIITQFCFDNNKIMRFRDRLLKAGIDVPIRIGLLSLFPVQKTINLAEQYSISIPENYKYDLQASLLNMDHDHFIQEMIALCFMVEQAKDLIKNDFKALHFYTLNHYKVIFALCKMIGIEYINNEEYNISLQNDVY